MGITQSKTKEEEDLEKAFLHHVETQIKKGTNRLDLSNKYLKKLSFNTTLDYSNIKWLNLSYNLINNIQPICDLFNNLVLLRLNGNHISKLHEDFSKLISLESLDLSKNKFKLWDPTIFKLNQLTDLNLQFNQINEV